MKKKVKGLTEKELSEWEKLGREIGEEINKHRYARMYLKAYFHEGEDWNKAEKVVNKAISMASESDKRMEEFKRKKTKGRKKKKEGKAKGENRYVGKRKQ